MLRKINNLFIIIFGAILLQSATLLEQTFCKNWKTMGGKPGEVCSFIKKTKITKPAKFIVFQSANLNKLLKNKSSSGTIVKKLPETRKRFESIDSGFTFNYKKGSRPEAGYILLSVADPNNDGIPLIELWDLNNQKKIHKWNLNTSEILKKINIIKKDNAVRFLHPLLLKDGSITITHLGGAIVKISPKGELIKFNDEYIFHHSQEIDIQGKIYTPIYTLTEVYTDPNMKKFSYRDGFAILDQELNVLKTYFLKDIYEKAGLAHQIFSPDVPTDVFHLNDVQPIRNDKKTNVVLLSLRNQSNIIAFDLVNEKVLWLLQGYSKFQHDVDILDSNGKIISIFDNNVNFNTMRSEGNKVLTIGNLPTLADSKKDGMKLFINNSNNSNQSKISVKEENFNTLNNELIPISPSNGRSEYIFNSDSLYIEETDYGRLFEYDTKDKNILWQYINRNDFTNNYYITSWSRRYQDIPSKIKNISK